jgi:dihydroneopterin aldolase/D-erythro-7,8-dihydroneopterin triphosphate epimerase
MSEQPLDRILIEGLHFHCIVGINEWERVAKQLVVIDVTLHADLSAAGKSDSIEDTVNYRTVTQRIAEVVEGSKFGLIEALTDRVAEVCLEDSRIERVDVRLRKPGALRLAESVGLEITRSR